MPGVDLILPDIRYLIEERKNIVGLVITHGHEDHIGALIDLWPRLKVPLYATPFTAALFEAKRRPSRARPKFRSMSCRWAAGSTLGPFDDRLHQRRAFDPGIQCAGDPHAGRHVLHTGDWKIDPTPIIGAPTDAAKLTALGDAGVLALIGDFDQCRARRALAVGIRRRQDACRTDPHRAAARRGDDVCLPCRPGARRGRSCARRRPRGRSGRPRHGARCAGGARDRLSRRRSGFPQRDSYGYLPPDKVVGAVHRQPGRAARRAVAHRRGRASRSHAGQGRPRDLFVARHPRQRKGGGAGDQRPGRRRASRSSPTARIWFTSPAIRAATNCAR